MALPIHMIKGVSAPHAEHLKKHGLGNSDKYLAATRTPEMRRELAQSLEVSENMVLEHANRCDLARIKGVGRIYSNLLEDAGVDTVLELSKRIPENLQQKLAERNVGKTISHRNPTIKQVKNWVAQAKRLPRALEY